MNGRAGVRAKMEVMVEGVPVGVVAVVEVAAAGVAVAVCVDSFVQSIPVRAMPEHPSTVALHQAPGLFRRRKGS